MIKLQKSSTIPSVLRNKGATETSSLCSSYDLAPSDYQTKTQKFSFDSVYGHSTVKSAIGIDQNYKCCYCETRYTEYGDVEHYRPKGFVQQDEKSPEEYPGYYWLAYSWNNLFLSCERCNTSFKRNYFPLEDPSTRAKSHHDNLTNEKPLIINPYTVDPADYLSFREEIVFSINGNALGNSTIRYTGLDRDQLDERRREHLGVVKGLYETIKISLNYPQDQEFQSLAQKARTALTHAVSDKGEYAGMIRAWKNSNNISF